MTYLYGHESEEIRSLQKALAALGLYRDIIDGGFGDNTLQAVKDAQGIYGLPETGVVDLPLLIDLGLAKKQRTTIQDLLTRTVILSALYNLAKGLSPMLAGYKTYITAAVLGIVAAYSLIFGDLPLVGHVDPGSAIMAILSGLGLGFARSGAKSDADK